MTVNEIYYAQQAINSTRYNMPIDEASQLKAPVDDLYKLVFVKFSMPTLDLSHVEIVAEPLGVDALNYIPGVVVNRYDREPHAKININPSGTPLQEYYLAMVLLNTYCKGNQRTRMKFSGKIFDQLRLYFDTRNFHYGRSEDGQQIILGILFELDKRGYVDLVTIFDELVKSETISGPIIIEIQQYLGERAKSIDIEKKFEL